MTINPEKYRQNRVDITPEYFPQFIRCLQMAFILFTIFCLLGIAASLKRGKRQPVSVSGTPAPGK